MDIIKCLCKYSFRSTNLCYDVDHAINNKFVFTELHTNPRKQFEVYGTFTVTDCLSIVYVQSWKSIVCGCKKPIFTFHQFNNLLKIINYTNDKQDIISYLDIVWESHGAKR